MKRSLPSLITGTALILILVTYLIAFTVDYKSVAVVRTFGQITPPDPVTGKSPDIITEQRPYPYLKWPWPIQRVQHYDTSIQQATAPGEEISTRDAKNVIVTTTTAWRIGEPYTFSIKCTDMKDAERKLITLVRDKQKIVMSSFDFANLLSTSPQELKYDQIEQQILAAVKADASKLYGVDVQWVGITKLVLPANITQTVFEAMKKERQAVAARFTSEGESTAKQIKDTAEGISNTILAFADRKAAEIVAEGQRRAAQYNEVFRKDEPLQMFLLEMRSLANILKDRSTIILEAKDRPFQHLLPNPDEADIGKPTDKTEVPATRSADKQAAALAPLPEIVEMK